MRGREGQEGFFKRHEADLCCSYQTRGRTRVGKLPRKLRQQISLCRQKLEGELGRTDCFFWIPFGDQKDHLYNQFDRKSQWKNKKIHEKQAIVLNR